MPELYELDGIFSPSVTMRSIAEENNVDDKKSIEICDGGTNWKNYHVVWIVPQPTLSDALVFMNEASSLLQLCRCVKDQVESDVVSH